MRENARAEDVVLSVQDLTISRSDGVDLVAGVSFDLGRGQILGLVGESGSGKTLTSLALVGALPRELSITGGSIRVGSSEDDAPATNAPQRSRSDVAIVFQDAMSCLNPAYTIGRQMRRILVRRGAATKERAEHRIIELLGMVGMPDPKGVASQYPHQLSGGMRQRVMIAIAVGVGPELLIADEPTTALDVTVQAQILELLGSLRRELGLAVIMVTHDLGVVADMCDDLLVMRNGGVVERGETTQVFENTAHPYTRQLLESTRRLERPPTEKTAGVVVGQPFVGARRT